MTLPLTLPGIAAGSLLVFIPAVGEFVIPDLLGGPDTLMIGKLLWQEFFDNVDWPAARAVAVALVVVLIVPLLLLQRSAQRRRTRNERAARLRRCLRRWASAFSMLPIAALVAYSLQRLAAGHDLGRVFDRWYGALCATRRSSARR